MKTDTLLHRSYALCSQDQHSASAYSDSLFGEHFSSDHSFLVCRLMELRKHGIVPRSFYTERVFIYGQGG